MSESKPTLSAGSGSTEITRFNAIRHGVLSRYTVLPREDAGEYESLAAALVNEHAPQGPTEEHLVEEVVGILWRKRRLRLAEAAAHRRGLSGALKPYRETTKAALAHLNVDDELCQASDAVRATAESTAADQKNLETDEAMTRRALDLLGSRRNDAYEAALAALREDTREWWESLLAGEVDWSEDGQERPTADVEGLRRFLEREVMQWYPRRRAELANRPFVREQAFGEALEPDKLERLVRYEIHLDRKLERMLAMLLRLKDLRQGAVRG
jgi:hypothetical protein